MLKKFIFFFDGGEGCSDGSCSGDDHSQSSGEGQSEDQGQQGGE